jgi:exosortase/archaeosortase family protein
MAGVGLRNPLMGQVVLIAALLPTQVLINRFLPTGPLAVATARFAAPLLTLVGRPSFPVAHRIVMPDRVLLVDASCTGVNTLSLSLAAAVLLVLLLPPPFFRRWGGRGSIFYSGLLLAAFSMAAAFVVNAMRVALLGLTRQSSDAAGLARFGSFEFWHDGTGSHVFSLAAMLVVCGAYVLCLEIDLRQRTGGSS